MAKYIVQHRRATAAQWAETDTLIPSEGEIVIEIDEVNSLHKLKIGDGIHTYAELAYLMAGDEIVTQVLSQALPHVVMVTLDVDAWVENVDVAGCYSQAVALDKITKHSRLDLQPDATMIAELKSLGVSFVTENINGTITVHSVGNKPTKTYTMQGTVVETDVEAELEKVIGIPVGAANSQSYTETDPTVPAWAKEPSKPTYTYDEITDKPTFATVATSGSYNDLSNQPTIPSLDGYATETYVTTAINNAQLSGGDSDIDLSVYALKADVPDELADLKSDASHRTVTDSEKEAWNAKSTFSGSYSDLKDAPSIPEVLPNPNKLVFAGATTGEYDGSKEVTLSIPSAPVTSVNGKTGVVVLTASDIGIDTSGTTDAAISIHDTSNTSHADIRGQISENVNSLNQLETNLNNKASQTIIRIW